jgi:hypothetical protein
MEQTAEVKRKRGRPRKDEVVIHEGRQMIYVEGRYEYVHRLVMEEYLGRKLLPHEIVLHENEDLNDNRLDNLILTDRKHPESWVEVRCASCNQPITRRAYHAKKRRFNFCSPQCYANGRKDGLYD